MPQYRNTARLFRRQKVRKYFSRIGERLAALGGRLRPTSRWLRWSWRNPASRLQTGPFGTGLRAGWSRQQSRSESPSTIFYDRDEAMRQVFLKLVQKNFPATPSSKVTEQA